MAKPMRLDCLRALAQRIGDEDSVSRRESEQVESAIDGLLGAAGSAILACEIAPVVQKPLAAPPIPHPHEFKRTFARFLML